MKQNGHKASVGGQFLMLKDRDELRQLIDREAQRHLRLSGQQVVDRIRSGTAGDNYVWSHLSMLTRMLD